MIMNQIGGGSKNKLILGNLLPGSVVYFSVDNSYYTPNSSSGYYSNRPFIVIHQGKPSNLYGDSCDGTWLMSYYVLDYGSEWKSQTEMYANSGFDTTLNTEFYNKIESTSVKAAIKEVKIPYYNGTNKVGEEGLSRKIFALNIIEMGLVPTSDYSLAGSKLDFFIEEAVNASTDNFEARVRRYAPRDYQNGKAFWYAPSNGTGARYRPRPYNATITDYISDDGVRGYTSYDSHCYVRPALIMRSDTPITKDGTVLGFPS